MQSIVFLASIIATATIIYGVRALRRGQKGNVRQAIGISTCAFGTCVMAMFVMMFLSVPVLAAPATDASTAVSFGEGLKYIAAALSTGLATMGTGRAVGAVGSAAIGAVSEDSSILGKTLIFVGMAEGIAIYGMIISILILFI